MKRYLIKHIQPLNRVLDLPLNTSAEYHTLITSAKQMKETFGIEYQKLFLLVFWEKGKAKLIKKHDFDFYLAFIFL